MVVDLPTPGRAGDADARRLAGLGQQLLHQPVRLCLMVGALALDQRDRARERRAVAGAQALDGEGWDVGRRSGHRAAV